LISSVATAVNGLRDQWRIYSAPYCVYFIYLHRRRSPASRPPRLLCQSKSGYMPTGDFGSSSLSVPRQRRSTRVYLT
jgi:hypothetical protein